MAYLGGLLGGAQAPGSASIGGLLGNVGNFFSNQRAQNPALLNGVAASLMNGGNVPAAMSEAQAEQLKKWEAEQGMALREQALAQDQSQFDQTFGLQREAQAQRQSLMASEAQKDRQLQNATADFLEANGADASLVALARAGQGAAAFKAYQDTKGGGETEFGVTPGYGVDANGNTVPMMFGKNGTIRIPEVPNGITPLSPGGINDQKAYGTATGRSRGESATSLPGAEQSASYALQKIDDVLNDPDLSSATGWQGALPSFPGTSKKNLDVKIEQLKGQTFLQAFESLKGAGQITEVEGAKAQNAIARLDQAQGDDEFKSALVDLKSVINNGLARSRQKAGGAAETPMASPSLKSKYGLE